MTSKTRLLIWLGVVFALLLAACLWFLTGREPWLKVGVEIIIPVLFGITVILINKTFQPIQTIGKSMNLLREEDFTVTLVKTGNPDVDRIVDVYNAMIGSLREERLSVREKNHFLDLLIESSPMGIVITDFDEQILEVNPAGCRMLGIPPETGSGFLLRDLKSPVSAQLATLDYQEKRTIDLTDGQKYLCRKLFFMDHGFRHPFYIIEEFSEEIREAEKAAYGKLIRMMAHEVNNTVGSVNSILMTVLDNRKSIVSEEQDEVIRMLEVAVQRNYRLNRFMQNFSDVVKLPKPEKERFDLNASLNSVVNSFNPVLSEKHIKIRLDLSESAPTLLADQSQMEQVFINLIKNSIEAMGSQGALTVCTLTDPIRISICDDGPGLSPQAREKLFTPFFSTKADGQGIGLTLVREILINHGFPFQFTNREEGGTRFEITIP
jgi:nitrogen fixation/metabolism regulation signal transduction histidine kinase